MTNEANHNVHTVSHPSKVVRKKRKKHVLTNQITTKQKQTNKTNDKKEKVNVLVVML